MSRLPYSNNNCFENSCYGPRLGWSGAGWGVREAGLEGGGLQAWSGMAGLGRGLS